MSAPAVRYRPLVFGVTRAVLRDGAPGTQYLSAETPLAPYRERMTDRLAHWAERTPDRTFIARRERLADGSTGDWLRVSYAQALEEARGIGQALLERGLSAERPVAILSENGIEHALMALGCLYAGVPYCPVSPPYSVVSQDFEKLRHVFDTLTPGLVFASDAARFAKAIAAVVPTGTEVVLAEGSLEDRPVTAFSALASTPATSAIDEAMRATGPDTITKFLFTSGSTKMPKAVINTHRMWCANQQQLRQSIPALGDEPPVLVDWLPWSHTFGANHNFNMVLAHGGSLYIDEGRPAPGLIEKTLANLREVRPNFHFNVPRGFDMLLPYLEQDAQAAREVFERLDGIFYAGAALPQSTWERLEKVARSVRERPVWFTSAWGATETSPAITTVHWQIERAGCIGLPLPGCEVKLVPNGGKLEMRVKGPQVFASYRNAPELTAAAFDDEGFYCIGDAGRLVDPKDPSRGIAFDGRVAEDFKLTTGTWVSVGTLRLRAVSAMSPFAADAVITGHDRHEIGLLVFLSPQGREADRDEVRAHVLKALREMRAGNVGSSQCPARALLLEDMPAMEAGEITDKGYINQRAVLNRRAAEVEALHAAQPDARVIAL